MMATATISELKKSAKLPANQAGGATVKQFFDLNKASIAAVLPRHLSADRMLRIAMTALRTTPKLRDCSVESLLGAIITVSSLGLEPNTPLAHVYLIPYKNKRKGITEVQVIPGYKGLIDLARRSGQIVSIAAHVVHENDLFEFEYGLDEKLRHIPARSTRGEVIGVYAVAKLKDGGHQFEVMWRNEIDVIMKSTQSKGEYGPWRDHFAAMARKTAIRRLAKYLPISIEMATAVRLDALAADEQSQTLDGVLDGELIPDAPDDVSDADALTPEQEGLYSKIRAALDNPSAETLAGAKKLIDQFPDHPLKASLIEEHAELAANK